MDANQNTELTKEQIERFKLAYQISKEIVEEHSFPAISEYVAKEFNEDLSHFYKIDDGKQIYIYAEVGTQYSYITIKYSLTLVTHEILWFWEFMCSDELVSRLLKPSVIYKIKKRKLSILDVLNTKESEIDGVIRENTKKIINMFIIKTPFFTRSAIIDAMGYSKLGFYQHFLKPLLKSHWEQLGLPKDFDLVSEDELDDVRRRDTNVKRWFLGDKKQFLNINTLADEAKSLLLQYKNAKKIHAEHKKSFYLINRSTTQSQWEDYWFDIQNEKFSELHFEAFNELETNPKVRPFELVQIHLSNVYDYNRDSIRQKITESKKLKNSSA